MPPDKIADPAAATQGPAASDGLSSRFIAGALATFLVLLLCAEIGSRLALASGFLYRRLDLFGSLSSLSELRDRIRWAGSRPRPVFLLGDSVLGASALVEHGANKARRRTIPAFLRELAARDGWTVQNLAADGLLLPDLEAVGQEIRRAPPQRLVILLNFRMFAGEFADPAHAASRDFLIPSALGGLPRAPAGETSLDARLSVWAVEHSGLVRTAGLLQPLWYYPTRRDFYRRLMERVTGDREDPDLRDAALRLKVASYYRDKWSDSIPAFHALGRLLSNGIARERALVVLTPQNPDFIEDRETFEWNRRVLRDFVGARAGAWVEYRDFADRFPSDQFLDHCHLTTEGNREYARALFGWIES